MLGGAIRRSRIAPSRSSAPALAALLLGEGERDVTGVAIPRPEIQIVARFMPSTPAGLDVHALGARSSVYRKRLRRGHRAVTARLRLGASNVVLGAPASVLAGRIVPLEELWGAAAARRLLDRLAEARDMSDAASILDLAIAERVAIENERLAESRLALEATERLTTTNVKGVARELGMSERHLRRVFREVVGLGPKTFAKLARFRRALGVARRSVDAGWASIAAEAGYYDQSHLIADFRVIAGATPQAFLAELRAVPMVG